MDYLYSVTSCAVLLIGMCTHTHVPVAVPIVVTPFTMFLFYVFDDIDDFVPLYCICTYACMCIPMLGFVRMHL